MKMHYLLLIVFTRLLLPAQSVDPIDRIADLLKHGNVHELAQNFSSTIDLTIIKEENIYSATQAELILADFFKHNPPKAIKVLHRVSSNPNYSFAVLILTTDNGPYRTSVSLKSINGKFILNELRIESEKTK